MPKLSAHLDQNEPIHHWFGLSYQAYLVLPRSALQSMPPEWQSRFIDMVEEVRDKFGHLAADEAYLVEMEDGSEDPLKDYQRGRRRLQPKATAETS